MAATGRIDQQTIKSYLDELRVRAPRSTYRSQKSTLSQFSQYHSRNGTSDFGVEGILNFLTDESELAPDTIQGQLDTLVNFEAYRNTAHPGHLKQTIIQIIRDETDTSSPFNPEYLSLPISPLNEREATAVQVLMEAFRKYWYGSQIHLFLELLIDTGNNVEPLLEIYLNDIDDDFEVISIPLPSNFAVCQYGLQTHWKSSLTSRTAALIKNHSELTDGERSPHAPLFESTHGQLSKTSLYRNYCDARQKAITTLTVTNADQLENLRGGKHTLESVSLEDVRRYAHCRGVSDV